MLLRLHNITLHSMLHFILTIKDQNHLKYIKIHMYGYYCGVSVLLHYKSTLSQYVTGPLYTGTKYLVHRLH